MVRMQSHPITDPYPQQLTISRRLPMVAGFLIFISALLVISLARYQWLSPDVEREFLLRGQANVNSVRRLPAERGIIYDRDGQPFAFNIIQYEIGVSPNLVADGREGDIARSLATILNSDELAIYQRVTSNLPWVQIARPVSADLGQAIAALDELSIRIDPLSRRFYPQDTLASQIIGFVIEENDTTRGAIGIEASYNNQLAGRSVSQQVSAIPFDLPVAINEESGAQRGMDVVLTIDRDIQFWVEAELALAIEEYQAASGTIIVMDPRNGDILAMASYPTFNPNDFINTPAYLLRNPAIGDSYEPGSTLIPLTLAAAIERGVVSPQWTYNDQGSLPVGGVSIRNWDGRAYGVTDATQVLVQSLNVGTSTMAIEMGTDAFYSMMRTFGLGQRTRIDLPGEATGIIKTPGEDWSESDLATNSFGQGISVTPLQLISAISAIANDGLMYQPRVVQQIINDGEVIPADAAALVRVISPQTANVVTQMMIRAVDEGATLARLEGYSIAGKAGTAQIPGPTGYEAQTSIVTFVGFLPADDPQVVILVKLDRPEGYWAAQVAAPVFRRIAERLVILLGIPNDAVRQNLGLSSGESS